MAVYLPVTETYLNNLVSELKSCHGKKGVEYLEKLARDENYEDCLDDLEFLSDALFYLDMFTVDVNENKYLHWLKEKAMHICSFTEENLSAPAINIPILLESGGLIITEDGLYYLQQES